MQASKFIPRFYGYVAVNKKPSENTIKVHPTELLPFVDGELDEVKTKEEIEGVDRKGNKYVIAVESDTTITCDWLPFNSNRTTAPDVRRGEDVIVYQYENTDRYYWMVLGNKKHLRKLEHVVIRFSNTRDEADTALTDENSYYMIFSTMEKHITIQTTKNDGEPYEYTIQLNTQDGNFRIEDDIGNIAFLDSAENHIGFKNANDSVIEINKEVANIFTNKEINFKTETLNTEVETYNLKATNVNREIETQSNEIETDNQSITTANYEIGTWNVVFDTAALKGITTHTGNYTIVGTATVGGIAVGGGGGSGNAEISGNIKIGGNGEVSGTQFVVGGKDVGPMHKHSSGGSGPVS